MTELCEKDKLVDMKNKEPWFAVSLSFFIPGCGHIYINRYAYGIVLLVLAKLFGYLCLASLASVRYSVFVSLFFVLCRIAILIYACIDVHKATKQTNTDEFEKARTASKDPWLAVFWSVIYPGFGHGYLRRWGFLILFSLADIILSILLKVSFLAYFTRKLFMFFVCLHAYMISPNKANRKINSVILLFVVMILAVFMAMGRDLILERKYGPVIGVISGASMEPTLIRSDKILIIRKAYIEDDPKICDIVTFDIPEHSVMSARKKEIVEEAIREGVIKEGTIILVSKRVVAIGGETIQIKEGKVYVDGKIRTFGITQEGDELIQAKETLYIQNVGPEFLLYGIDEPYTVPEDHYFLLGDNIYDSMDSRSFGALPKDAITGKVLKIIWPPRHIGVLY